MIIAPWNDPTIRWVCEQHPTKDFGHKVGLFRKECAGPWMPESEGMVAATHVKLPEIVFRFKK